VTPAEGKNRLKIIWLLATEARHECRWWRATVSTPSAELSSAIVQETEQQSAVQTLARRFTHPSAFAASRYRENAGFQHWISTLGSLEIAGQSTAGH